MKRYSLQTKSYVEVISDNFSETLKSFGGFVGCLAGTGIIWGIIRNMDIAGKLSSNDEIKLVPGIFALCAVFFAKQMYKNFKEERERIHQLALEIEKEKSIKKQEYKKSMSDFITPDQMSQLGLQKSFDADEKVVELKKYRDILVSDKQENNGATQGKRKSLNNGIFSPNDTY